MRITIDLAPDVEKWLTEKVQSGSIVSPDQFINATLQRDLLEEQLEHSLREPATPLTADDWENAHRTLALAIQKQK